MPAWPRPTAPATAPGTRPPPAWWTPRRPDSPPGYASWGRSRPPVPTGPPGCWRSVRCSISSTGASWGSSGCPAPLAATVRSRVGLTTEAADLLTGPDATTVRDRWLVLAQQDSDDGKLVTRRIFLRGERTGRMALHLSFGGAHRPMDTALPPGLVLDAELAYYPGARPLRATLGERHAPAAPGPVPPGNGIDAALAAYGDALRDDPWLDSWPVVLADVTPIPGRDGAELATGRRRWRVGAPARPALPGPFGPVAAGRPVRWRSDHGLRGVRAPRLPAAHRLGHGHRRGHVAGVPVTSPHDRARAPRPGPAVTPPSPARRPTPGGTPCQAPAIP